MNVWTKRSIDLANQGNYLDLLHLIYPMPVNLRRKISNETRQQINFLFTNRKSEELIRVLLDQEIFPIKDSYVAYIRRDKDSIVRNPQTIHRLAFALYNTGLPEMFDRMTAAKETNRQIGPMFRAWLKSLPVRFIVDYDPFLRYGGDAILCGSDAHLAGFAKQYLGYTRDKGLDLVAKINGKFVIGEAKFLTDFGGHQNAQFEDAILTLQSALNETIYEVKTIAVLDGVLYIEGNNKLHGKLREFDDDTVVLSAVLLRDYLCSL